MPINLFQYSFKTSLVYNNNFAYYYFECGTVSYIPGGYKDPGPYSIFGSMQKDAVGCRISNGSWSAPTFGKYTTRCRLYDNALHEQYSDVLFVTSAGNRGNDVPGEQYGTIGDPASCKNTLAGMWRKESSPTEQIVAKIDSRVTDYFCNVFYFNI